VGQSTWVSPCGARVPSTDVGAGSGAGRDAWAKDTDTRAAQVSERRPDVTSRSDVKVLGVPK
jgi:hypothetical protein